MRRFLAVVVLSKGPTPRLSACSGPSRIHTKVREGGNAYPTARKLRGAPLAFLSHVRSASSCSPGPTQIERIRLRDAMLSLNEWWGWRTPEARDLGEGDIANSGAATPRTSGASSVPSYNYGLANLKGAIQKSCGQSERHCYRRDAPLRVQLTHSCVSLGPWRT